MKGRKITKLVVDKEEVIVLGYPPLFWQVNKNMGTSSLVQARLSSRKRLIFRERQMEIAQIF